MYHAGSGYEQRLSVHLPAKYYMRQNGCLYYSSMRWDGGPTLVAILINNYNNSLAPSKIPVAPPGRTFFIKDDLTNSSTEHISVCMQPHSFIGLTLQPVDVHEQGGM